MKTGVSQPVTTGCDSEQPCWLQLIIVRAVSAWLLRRRVLTNEDETETSRSPNVAQDGHITRLQIEKLKAQKGAIVVAFLKSIGALRKAVMGIGYELLTFPLYVN